MSERRRELELRVIQALVDLAEDMVCDAFALPVPDSDPRYFVCWGQAESILSMLAAPQRVVMGDAAATRGANEPHA